MDLAPPMEAVSPTPSRVRLRDVFATYSRARTRRDSSIVFDKTDLRLSLLLSSHPSCKQYSPVHHTLVLLIPPAFALFKPETLSGTSPCFSSRTIVSLEHTQDPEVVLVREIPVGELPKRPHHPPLKIRLADMTTRRSHSRAPPTMGIPAAL
jgi:hypothetical protein